MSPLGPSQVRIDLVVEDYLAAARLLGLPICRYPDCLNTTRTRGLCHGHYQAMRAKVRAGKADEADLVQRGLLAPKGTGGAKVNGTDLFNRGGAK